MARADRAGTEGPGRRSFLKALGGLGGVAVATGSLGGCARAAERGGSGANSAKPIAPPAHAGHVRVASVYVPITSGLMDVLVQGFARRSAGLAVSSVGGGDPLSRARAGDVDLVICHWGHTDNTSGNYSLEDFVDGGYGYWPRAVFSSQAVLVGVASDPAGVRGMTDMVEAFRRIAARGAPYIVDNTDWIPYLGDYLADAAGVSRSGWYIDLGTKAHAALAEAEQRGGYTLWGGVPFWSEAQVSKTSLVPMVWGDPTLQRMMVSVVVDPARVRGVNAPGATAFQQYLMAPAAQAAVREFRVAGFTEAPLFWPAGGENNPFILPSDRPNESALNPGGGTGGGSGQ